MKIRNVLLLCLLTVTLALTGPFARGLSAQAAVLLQSAELSRSGSVSTPKAGAVPSKRCLRGAVSWSGCGVDPGHVPRDTGLGKAGVRSAFERVLDGTSGDLSRSRLFRPPRSS